MDQKESKSRKAAKAVQGRAINWLQQKLQMPSQKNMPSQPTGLPTNAVANHGCVSSYRGLGTNEMSAHVKDELRLRFESTPLNHYHHKRGSLPVAVSSIDFLDDVHSETTYVKRDLGFQGHIGPHILLTYGDTVFSDANYSSTWRGMTSNSVALATYNPTKVVDVNLIKLNNVSYPRQFCPVMPEYGEDSATWACGITNVVETCPGQGILFYLLNSRPDGVNNLIGAGVATIAISNAYPPVPSLTRLPGQQYWWDASCEPWYGDVGSIKANDGYIYAYGHAKDLPWIYVARVPWQSATDLFSYEYWNGENWQTERLYTTNGLGEKEGVFWQINQGQIIWSTYYNCYIFVYCDNWLNNKVLTVTADAPEGPWSDPITLYQATPMTQGSSIYAAVPHPYYDQTGQTLVITFTNHPNCIQAIRVVSRCRSCMEAIKLTLGGPLPRLRRKNNQDLDAA